MTDLYFNPNYAKVYKDIDHSSIIVTLSEWTYNGQPQTPTVTVKDGETVLTAAVNYLVIATPLFLSVRLAKSPTPMSSARFSGQSMAKPIMIL